VSDVTRELNDIVGDENVLDEPVILDSYSHDHSFALPFKPRRVVKPDNADEIQALVRWANQTKTGLVPLSSGAPHFRGDTIPSTSGAVVVDLSNMTKIININRRNRVAVIEPGVTYPQLQSELSREGLRLANPLLPRVNKSVVASILEREPTLIPKYQWMMLEPLRATEVIFGDGELLRTGEGGDWRQPQLWESKQAPIGGNGPSQTDFWRLVSAAQGSMGIVTYASVKCQLLPKIHKLYFVSSSNIEELIPFTYRLLRYRFGDELLILNNFALASILGGGADVIKTRAAELPAWSLLVGIAGRERLPEERVEFQEKDIADIARQFDLELVPEIPGAGGTEVLQKILSPSQEPYWKLDYKGGCQDIFFLSTLDRTPGFIDAMYAVAKENQYPSSEIGVYLQPLHQGASCHCEFMLPYSRADSNERSYMREFFNKASVAMLRQGAFFSRPYGIWANMAYNRDAQTTEVLRKLKGIFDPHNVMNPGKLCF
jgi:FAD/FMN-containing dehydrogenase